MTNLNLQVALLDIPGTESVDLSRGAFPQPEILLEVGFAQPPEEVTDVEVGAGLPDRTPRVLDDIHNARQVVGLEDRSASPVGELRGDGPQIVPHAGCLSCQARMDHPQGVDGALAIHVEWSPIDRGVAGLQRIVDQATVVARRAVQRQSPVVAGVVVPGVRQGHHRDHFPHDSQTTSRDPPVIVVDGSGWGTGRGVEQGGVPGIRLGIDEWLVRVGDHDHRDHPSALLSGGAEARTSLRHAKQPVAESLGNRQG